MEEVARGVSCIRYIVFNTLTKTRMYHKSLKAASNSQKNAKRLYPNAIIQVLKSDLNSGTSNEEVVSEL